MQLQSTILVVITITLAALVDAGYVELFKDVNFKNKLLRVDNVLVDVCYNFVCDKLDNMITSAKWHGLPEKGSLFKGGDAVISFVTDKDCSGGDVQRWTINTQSKSSPNFPTNFKLNGIDNAISAFKVWNTGTDGGLLNICTPAESAIALNATTE
ncbi:Epsin-1, required for endocytosis and actin patch assembly [Phytophthora pseudosyringae]|uniref:Epsin-1, required for endocytosis and actin patch assembly n=1 Tax=Phytophthora pseudosyringae TaxID=221518 RepID=A0A8T1VMJ2_9STRA|nr:Epsin-1, required for endocytosis and actin patch assembly [Phytophthora pseudosyringae]